MNCGILEIGKTTYGSHKGKPLYKVNTNLNDKIYVPSNKPLGIYYVFIKEENDRWIIDNYIGSPGDYHVDCTYIISYLDIYRPSHQKKLKSITDIIKPPIEYDYEVFTIDPPNSEDRDDAFHFDEKTGEIGIHITNISSVSDDLIPLLKIQPESIYVDKNYHMLPKPLMESGSLQEGTLRHCLTLILSDEGIKWKITKVKVIHNYTYQYQCPEWIIKKLDVNTTTEMVTKLMTVYNSQAAILLKDKLSIFKSDQVYTRKYTGYTHCTSPLRRLVDLITQKQINSIITNQEFPNYALDLDKINQWRLSNKKAQLLFKAVQLSYKIKGKEEVDLLYTGYNNGLIFKIIPYDIYHIYNFDSKSIDIKDNKVIIHLPNKTVELTSRITKLKGTIIPNIKTKFPSEKLLIQPHF